MLFVVARRHDVKIVNLMELPPVVLIGDLFINGSTVVYYPQPLLDLILISCLRGLLVHLFFSIFFNYSSVVFAVMLQFLEYRPHKPLSRLYISSSSCAYIH